MRTTHLTIVVGLLLTTACSDPDPTKSAGYLALQRRLDTATADLTDSRDELAADELELKRLDAEAVVMKAKSKSQTARIREIEAEEQTASARAKATLADEGGRGTTVTETVSV